MDKRLLAWGLRRRGPVPRLWLFTDHQRLADPRASVAALPRGAAGVVLRHDGDPQRQALGRDLAQLCRDRRLILVVAGDARLAARLHAGMHLRDGIRPSSQRPAGFITSSAHGVAAMHRARRAGARVAFLSPAFPTASHAGAPGLGAARWSSLARRRPTGLIVGALGGIDGGSVRRLPANLCGCAGAIGALSAGTDRV